jgi:hypothetical protein
MTQFETDYADIIEDFIVFACQHLCIQRPVINFVEGTVFPEEHKTFGIYRPTEKDIHVCVEGRHMMDIFRTLAHELVHHRQILQEVSWPVSEMEAEANTVAAVIMRNYAKESPDMFCVLKEDVAVNSAGAGAVAGIGTGPQPEPGVHVRKRRFAGAEVFEVDRDVFHRARFGKKHYARYKDYVGEDGVGSEVRKYGNMNYGKPIVLQDRSTGAMHYLRYGRK